VTRFLCLLYITLLLCLRPDAAASQSADDAFVASVVASDDSALLDPAARDDSLTADQVEQMVRVAVERIGGMGRYVPADARLVALKPNVTIPRPSGSGIITDTRVVRAVALLVHEVAPNARILVTEATAGWLHPALQDCSLVDIRQGTEIVDGWQIAGHSATVAELRARGLDIDTYDLNFDLLDTLRIADGGLSDDEFILPRTITRADAWINLPVGKPHGAKMTACMKNRFGILPGAIYGWGRASGTERHAGINHAPQIIDETFVDLLTVEREDLCICDMIHNVEGGAFSGAPRRSNLVIAGSDPVATDLVVARLMGFNPDDMEYADLAWQRGLGPRFIERVQVDGDLAALSQRFIKAGADYGGDWSQHADYGMGARRWTLLGPLPRDHAFTDAERRQLRPRTGDNGWSELVFFGHDRIDLDRYYDDPIHCAVYAFTRFTTAAADSVHFWIGSDEGMTVWIDGDLVYEHEGRRNHVLGGDRIPAYLGAGEHTLLIRVEQGRGRFDFSFNVCESIDDRRYAGNRLPGLRYAGESIDAAVAATSLAAVDRFDDGWSGNDMHVMTIPGVEDPTTFEIPDSAYIDIEAPRSRLFLDVAATIAGVPPLLADTSAMEEFHASHAWFARMPIWHDWYPEDWPGISRYFDWARLDYGISYGHGRGEAFKAMKGWLAQGHVPMIGHGGDWYAINGYRDIDGVLQWHQIEPDSSYWSDAADLQEFWGNLVNRRWAFCPVVVAAPKIDAATVPIVDAWAEALVQKATENLRHEVDSGPWGTRSAVVGIAAWDDWVIEWERLPWTPDWAMGDYERRCLQELDHMYEAVADNHGGLSRFFAWASAEETDARRQRLLRTAAEGYGQIEIILDSMRVLLPGEKAGHLDAEGEARMARIGELRGAPRRLRHEARRALTALVELTDARALPPLREDPLNRRDQGHRVLTWRASVSKGIHHVLLKNGVVTSEWYHGRELEGIEQTMHDTVPADPGWQIALEPIQGYGFYSIVEQPTLDNDWTTRILVDDEWTTYDNSTEFVLWAVPASD
jgi:uncharacterized protein (DUF362 family)